MNKPQTIAAHAHDPLPTPTKAETQSQHMVIRLKVKALKCMTYLEHSQNQD